MLAVCTIAAYIKPDTWNMKPTCLNHHGIAVDVHTHTWHFQSKMAPVNIEGIRHCRCSALSSKEHIFIPLLAKSKFNMNYNSMNLTRIKFWPHLRHYFKLHVKLYEVMCEALWSYVWNSMKWSHIGVANITQKSNVINVTN